MAVWVTSGMYCESDSDSSDTISERSDYPFPFCHNDFINQEDVNKHVEICSGTDTEPEVLKLICPNSQKTFETYDKIEKHIGIHTMRLIRNLHNLSQQHQQPRRVNRSH